VTTPIHQVVMACGHVADSLTADGQIYCSRCIGETLASLRPVTIQGVDRFASCMSCEAQALSEPEKLSFFTFRDSQEDDRFWCGCNG
jgi:hypothetical protein